MKIYDKPHALNDYLNVRFTCDCGKEHFAPLKEVLIGENANDRLPELVRKYGYKNVMLVADEITYGIAGKRCEELLKNAGIRTEMLVLRHLGFDEATLGEIFLHLPAGCDLCIAVGTGSISDIIKLVTFRMGIACFTVATAAPMDGFASAIAPIYVNNMKTTLDAHTPEVIIGDTEILKNAPYSMIAAGLGDLLGKYTCLCDWKISRIVTGEHYCTTIVELVEDCCEKVLADGDRAKDRDPELIGKIMEGLVLSGAAMALYGNSRSASGCEHHMSHYWEMIFEQRGERPVPHGTQVSVGMVMVLKLVEKLLGREIDFERAREHARAYDPEKWKTEIKAAYGLAAEGVIEMEEAADKNGTAGCLARIDTIQAEWPKIRELLANLPKADEMEKLLRSLGAPALPHEIRVDRALMKNTYLYCKEVRSRYTILQLMWDLGLLDELAEEVLCEVYA